MATHSSILAWRIPWTEESGRLQSIGLKRVRHDCSVIRLSTELINNVVTVSGGQQRDSAVHTHVSILPGVSIHILSSDHFDRCRVAPPQHSSCLSFPPPCPGRRGLRSCLEKAVWSSL